MINGFENENMFDFLRFWSFKDFDSSSWGFVVKKQKLKSTDFLQFWILKNFIISVAQDLN